MIRNYQDFLEALRMSGFSMGGGNDDGIYSIISWGWNENSPYETPVKWHTGDIDTDPWEWRMRVLDEETDIAYAKVFFKKSGFITKDLYPQFLAVRRQGLSFKETYDDGCMSYETKRIYEVIASEEQIPIHLLKEKTGFGKENQSAFDRALVELQMKLFVTLSGHQRKVSKTGDEYGWSSTVLTTTECFFGADVFKKAEKLTIEEAYSQIEAQILRVNPTAQAKKMKKFITG